MKKEMNDIKVKMIRMEGDVAPLVEVAYMDKYAQEHTGLMLLDSGSNVNILSCEMKDYIGELCKIEDAKEKITSIEHEDTNVEKVQFSFALGGRQYHDVFCVSTSPLPVHVKGMKFVGLLGIRFFLQHRLVIDYNDYTLHTSEVTPQNLSISDCDFFFPMEIGIKFYELPVISVKQNGKELVALVDSGSTDNMIAKQALIDNKFNFLRIKGKGIIHGLSRAVDVEKALVRFNVLSLDSEDVCEISRHDNFMVLPCNVLTPKEGECDTNGDQLPPIEVLIGSPFMAKEGWILDFGALIIYKRKGENYLKEAV